MVIDFIFAVAVVVVLTKPARQVIEIVGLVMELVRLNSLYRPCEGCWGDCDSCLYLRRRT